MFRVVGFKGFGVLGFGASVFWDAGSCDVPRVFHRGTRPCLPELGGERRLGV